MVSLQFLIFKLKQVIDTVSCDQKNHLEMEKKILFLASGNED